MATFFDTEFDHYFSAEVYHTVCSPCLGRECKCDKRKLKRVTTLCLCEKCGNGHRVECTEFLCDEHFSEVMSD